jgi:hypothetical protein
MESWMLQTLISTGGGIIAGILIERRRRKWELEKEAMKDHFEDIKKCLVRIRERVSELRFYFILDEAFSIPSPQSIEEDLQKDEIHWWGFFSFKGFECEPLLFEDLRNHYPGLYFRLISLEEFIREKYPDFRYALSALLRRMEEDPKFKSLYQEIMENAAIYPRPFEPYRQAALFLSLGIDQSSWPNIYKSVRERLSAIEAIGRELYNAEEAERVRAIRKDAFKMMEECLKNIEEIRLSKNLRGKCKYIKAS